MSRTATAVLKSVLALSREEQRELVDTVKEQWEEQEVEFDSETMAEIRKRKHLYDQGQMATVTWAEVEAKERRHDARTR